MERGIYFDAWFPRQHCYHPSLPARRLRMIDDLKAYQATVLVWSALGGGSLSLPYLEQEAFGEVPARFRFYGFVNDSEFIHECQKQGIKVFGIVFEVQGWEFPAELNEAEDAILALNELRGTGKQVWLGLREFSQNRYPRLWQSFEHYFPGGLRNSQGEEVTDLIEECCSRDIYGVPCQAKWVECPDLSHQCYMMDRNNPVWREYLKAIVRVQIDAGVDGLQLDEAELPITSFQYGGCFCRECMHGFRQYLKELPEERRPEACDGIDLDTFHYGSWLLEAGYDFKTNREDTPLFWDYLRYQQGAITRTFGEIADYAREYAAGKGRHVLVSGNFFNLFDHYYPLEPKVDLIITEMRNTRYRQPAWYRYVAGFAAGKPVIVVENPYGGVVPELVELLKAAKGYDLFRMSLYEAAALGANMSVPYGAWLGSVIQDSFYAPHDLCVEIQSFLAEHDALFSSQSYAETAVIYSIESNFQLAARRDLFADNRANVSGNQMAPFWAVCEYLANGAQPYDVIFFPEGELRPDTMHAEQLRQYRRLILPDCRYLTPYQADRLREYLDDGGRLVVIGELGLNLATEQVDELLGYGNVTRIEGLHDLQLNKLPDGPQVHFPKLQDLALHIHRSSAGAAIHVIRYDYDPTLDAVPTLPALQFKVRLPQKFTNMAVYSPSHEPEGTLVALGNVHEIELKRAPLYCILLLT